eukprot:7569577-Alexandrium_andersonii.AAC.1
MLWRQADLSTVLQQRVAALAFPPEVAQWCPCGAFRPQPLTLLRVDAAQFFKSANLDRGRANVRPMLARLRSSRGVNV